MATQKIHLVAKVTPNYRANTARAVYYAALVKHNGQTVKTFVTYCAAHPPSVPKSGKLKGKAEPITGWLSFFVREGVVTLS